MKILILTFSVYLTFIFQLSAQNTDQTSYTAFLLNSEALWERASEQAKDPWQKALALYGLLNGTMATQNEKLFDKYLEDTFALLEELETQEVHKANALALRSSVYGFIMGYSPWKGMYYGPKSSAAIEQALKLTESSGIVWMVKGNSLFYTPETFGGNKIEAENALEKSVRQFELAGDTTNNWLYLNAMAALGKTYHANGKKAKAIDTYQKALLVEPGFNWVSKVLLPQAKK